ncbi:hypothetical protein BFP70_19350 [Thioclava sp. SK-1]|uniref:hypothetical protein n=1 Tax=Thioclava sp. SK-1 TaxID=1889770 RepID=UPI0008241D82|nr:hypothetical protein [Thioclava sp. SK-1]OCX57384.1 hypothetical protein BFP70_19350 [Thioclava sp. SK-1]
MANSCSQFQSRHGPQQLPLGRVEIDEWQIDLKDIMPALAEQTDERQRVIAVAMIDVSSSRLLDIQILQDGAMLDLKPAAPSAYPL